MDELAATVQRHYLTVCMTVLSDEQAQEVADSLWVDIFEMADALAGVGRLSETFEERAARLATAEATARSDVLRENLPAGGIAK